MIPIEYKCDDVVSIRRCDELASVCDQLPAYWYLKRPMSTMEAPEIGWSRNVIREFEQRGLNVAYWDGKKWWYFKPKKFPTPEEAFAEWQRIEAARKVTPADPPPCPGRRVTT